MTVNPKDANDLAISLFGLSAAWIGENIIALIGLLCTIITLTFVARRYYAEMSIIRLQEKKLQLEIDKLEANDG